MWSALARPFVDSRYLWSALAYPLYLDGIQCKLKEASGCSDSKRKGKQAKITGHGFISLSLFDSFSKVETAFSHAKSITWPALRAWIHKRKAFFNSFGVQDGVLDPGGRHVEENE